MAQGNFQADTPGFKSLLLKTGACGDLCCKLGYSKDDVKCIEEELLQLLQFRDKPSLLSWSELMSMHALFGCSN